VAQSKLGDSCAKGNSMSDVKSKFEAALAQRKKQKAEEASRGNFSGGSGYPEIPYAPLYTDKQQAFRFVGLPYLVRENPTDSKRVHIAMILGDDDKKFRCIGPDPQEQKDWLLYRIMNKVLTRHWDKNLPNSNGQLGAYVYDYATLHPELYNRVAKNNNVENNLEKGWRFTPYILFNVIDRANYDWHRENKKFRVLSKKVSEWQDKVFFEPGVPDTVFQSIMDDIVAGDGNTNWEDYDIVIQKLTDKPWYKVLHGVDHVKYLDPDVRPLIVNKGLSDEERSWELNDFDRLFTVTRYGRIKSKIGLFIQKVDQVFKTKYYEELLSLVEKEEAEIAEQQMKLPPEEDGIPPGYPGASDDSSSAPASAASSETGVAGHQAAVSASQPTAPASPPVRAPSPAAIRSIPMTEEIWKGLADGTYNGKKYLGVPKMTPEEKALVLGTFEDGSFDWSPDAGDIMEGSSSHFLSGAKVSVDPLDGTVF
jgi:hypothetical protein